MKRTMSYGIALLIPLAIGCTSRTTQQGTSAPGSETGAPSTTPQPGAGGEQRPTGRMEQGTREEQRGGREEEQRQPGLGSGIGQTGQQGEQQHGGQQQGMMDERAICDSIASNAKLSVEDVQNGVAIVAAPKGGANLSTVRDDVRRLERAIHAGAGAEPRAGRGETCGLAELARLPSVNVQLTEGTSSVRMIMTTTNPGEVKDLRRIAREEISTMSKGGRSPQMDQPHRQQQQMDQQQRQQQRP